MGITETVALVGAIGAGLSSNARKAEIAELNEKLRSINVTLRQQIRSPGAMTVYPDGGSVRAFMRRGGRSHRENVTWSLGVQGLGGRVLWLGSSGGRG